MIVIKKNKIKGLDGPKKRKNLKKHAPMRQDGRYFYKNPNL